MPQYDFQFREKDKFKQAQKDAFKRAKKKRLNQRLQQQDRLRNLHDYPEVKLERQLAEQKKINELQRKKITRLINRMKELERERKKTKDSIDKFKETYIDIPEERETIEI